LSKKILPRPELKNAIPKAVRAAHGWEAGLEFIIENVRDGIKLKPIKPCKETTIEDVIGCVGKKVLRNLFACGKNPAFDCIISSGHGQDQSGCPDDGNTVITFLRNSFNEFILFSLMTACGVEGLGVLKAVAVSSDSAFVYVSASSDDALSVFRVDLDAVR
jgi:hypothetical protein